MDLKEVYNKVYINFVDKLKLRPFITFLKDQNLNGLVGCEIGTYKGFNALNICKNLDISCLYCVDPYVVDDVDNYRWKMDNIVTAKKTLFGFRDKVVFIKKKSCYAYFDIDKVLDFVYVDGDHSYKSVLKDIVCYYPLVRNGGFIGGHDVHFNTVYKAVYDFRDMFDVSVIVNYPDWWFIK